MRKLRFFSLISKCNRKSRFLLFTKVVELKFRSLALDTFFYKVDLIIVYLLAIFYIKLKKRFSLIDNLYSYNLDGKFCMK